MKKKLVAVLLSTAMVFSLAACGGGDAKTEEGGDKAESGDSKGYHFEVIVKSFQSTYWQAAVQGIDKACEELVQRQKKAETKQKAEIAKVITSK